MPDSIAPYQNQALSRSSRSSQLLRDFISLSRARIIGQIAATLAFLLVVSKAGPKEIGLYFLASTASKLITILVENGLGATLLSRPRIRSIETTVVADITAALTAVIAVLLLVRGR